jgi:hypothetical protein
MVNLVEQEAQASDGDGHAIDVLRARVADLEAENVRLLEQYAASLEAENRRIRDTMSAKTIDGSDATDMTPGGEAGRVSLTAAALARDLTRVEDQLAEVDRLVAVDDNRSAAKARVAAATLACKAFTRVCDDADFRQRMMELQAHASQLPPGGPNLSDISTLFSDFRSAEVAVLELVGMTRELAEKHVDAAIAAFESGRSPDAQRQQDPRLLLDDLRALRDATCQGADILALGVRRETSRARWRTILTYGLGGTVIVAANGLGTALLGPQASPHRKSSGPPPSVSRRRCSTSPTFKAYPPATCIGGTDGRTCGRARTDRWYRARNLPVGGV